MKEVALEQAVELRQRIRRLLARGVWLHARVVEAFSQEGSEYAVVVDPRVQGGWVQGVYQYRNSARRVAIHINRIVAYERLRTPRLAVLPGGAEGPTPAPTPRLVLLPGSE